MSPFRSCAAVTGLYVHQRSAHILFTRMISKRHDQLRQKEMGSFGGSQMRCVIVISDIKAALGPHHMTLYSSKCTVMQRSLETVLAMRCGSTQALLAWNMAYTASIPADERPADADWSEALVCSFPWISLLSWHHFHMFVGSHRVAL